MAKVLQSDLAQVGMFVKYIHRNTEDIFEVLALPTPDDKNFRLRFRDQGMHTAFPHSISAFNNDFVCPPRGSDLVRKNLEVYMRQIKSRGMSEEFQSLLVELEI